MKIYTYNENCTLAGQIAYETHYMTEDEFAEHGDLSCYGEGTPDELIAHALASLAVRYDSKGGAGDSFRWKRDRNVLAFLDGPAVQFDAETMTYRSAREQ